MAIRVCSPPANGGGAWSTPSVVAAPWLRVPGNTRASSGERHSKHDRKGMPMPVLMIGEVPNLTEDVYAGLIGQLTPLMRAHKGFVSHAAGPSPEGGWRVVEVWESEEDGQKWFDENVKPNLPPGVVPNRRYFPLHTAFTK